jgi:Uma2 family endonuclease
MSAVFPTIPPKSREITVEQYHAMIEAGVLTDDDPVELLEGVLVFKMPKKPAHRLALRKLARALEKLVPAEWFVQVQEPITLSTSEPEPDAAVIRGNEDDFASRHPGPAEVLMVVEVADTTLQRDRTTKLRAYAGAAIQTYWILNLIDRTLEVYEDPDSTASEPAYRRAAVLKESEMIHLDIDGTQLGSVTVASLLPPRR